MASLVCPLCCNQKFTSHQSLKCHLHNIVLKLENLACPSCNVNCENVIELTEHLDHSCVNLPQTSPYSEQTHLKKIKLENDLNEIFGSDVESESKNIQNDSHDDANMVYTCEMCNMTFLSVEEHLAKYHEGEEVILETEESEELAVVDSKEDIGNASVSYEGQTDEESDRTEVQNIASNVEEAIPLVSKYILEDGKARNLTDQEIANIEDKKRIMEVFICPNCSLQFPNIAHFKKHKCSNLQVNSRKLEVKHQMSKIKEDFRYQCTFCNVTYSTIIALNDHMKSHLVQDDTGMVHRKTVTMALHMCNMCNTKFPTYKQLRLHMKIHLPVKSKEVEAPANYNIMGQYTQENADIENSEGEDFECPVCGKTYNRIYEEVHLKSHKESVPTICLICNRKFESKDSLDLHTKVNHSKTKRFSCSYCKKPFNTYSALELHVNNECQTRNYECQFCGRRFQKAHEKVKHERIHTGEKPHVCEICGKAFRISFCLTLHMRTHSGSRPYACHVCGKRFKSHSVFKHHSKTHSDDRNYKCPYCPKAFKTAVQLAGHRNSHTKPFTCTECNRPFASLYTVKAHMQTHKRGNNLKHECSICGASYARVFALKDHLKNVHGQELAEKTEDEQAVLELESEEAHLGGQNVEMVVEGNGESVEIQQGDEEVQDNGNESRICHVQVLGEQVDGEGYVVHLQEVVDRGDQAENSGVEAQ
ncbi:hypothetical protein ABEB36_015496 [Hypothenemus hampei]|uniref:C2H2-type domain-containing protein n=1 Tax=Hypothenemus hampei TaxID=57062 RepID=A0ABD1E0H5_HYPHA